MTPEEIYQDYLRAKQHVETCNTRFNEVGADKRAIDIAIYELQAAELRLDHHIALLREITGKKVG